MDLNAESTKILLPAVEHTRGSRSQVPARMMDSSYSQQSADHDPVPVTVESIPLKLISKFLNQPATPSPAMQVPSGAPRNCSKTYKVPRRPFEAARLDQELKLVGEYGLRNKREIWRIGYTLSNIRRAARELLTLEDKDPRRLFEGNALIRRLVRIGVLEEDKMKLDYVLALKIEDFLERRLQTQVFKLGLAKSIHHARVLVCQRHIRVGRQVVDIPSFVVRLDSQKHIDFSLTSPYGGGRAGRVKRKRAAAAASKGDGEDEDEE